MEPNRIVMNSLNSLVRDFFTILPQLTIGLILLALTWLVAVVVDRAAANLFRRTRLRKSLAELFSKLIFIAIWIAGLLTVAVVIFPTVTPAKALTALGLGSIAIGFAFKDIFENFIAGMLILLREPFRLGDFIECQEHRGVRRGDHDPRHPHPPDRRPAGGAPQRDAVHEPGDRPDRPGHPPRHNPLRHRLWRGRRRGPRRDPPPRSRACRRSPTRKPVEIFARASAPAASTSR